MSALPGGTARTPDDPVGAFVTRLGLAGSSTGPLAGTTFGAKDLYDVAGHVTGCGSPDWARTHAAATRTASAVATLLDAGATLLGKTHTDELAWSLLGVNEHHGTPANPRSPERVPGGSSSGSAAACAAGLVDIGLGSDTGGSVRIPAAFCGLHGLRPTHGRIALDGIMPLAPSFDTVGFLCRDAATLARVAGVFGLMDDAGAARPRLKVAVDALALADEDVRVALAPAIDALGQRLGKPEYLSLADGAFSEWAECFRVCQAAEIWEQHGDWVTRTRPRFGAGVGERFAMAAALEPGEIAAARDQREAIRARLGALVAPGDVILLPSSPTLAPRRNADAAALGLFRTRALGLLSAAGLAGLPQLSVPVSPEGDAVGLGLLGAPGQDALLLRVLADAR